MTLKIEYREDYQKYYDKTILVIPARMGSTRLPNKPLAKIGDLSLIEHVASNIHNLSLYKIIIATDSQIIASMLSDYDNVEVVLTDSDIKTGTDRVFNAIEKILRQNNNIKPDYIINLQGDMPFVDNQIIYQMVNNLVDNQNADIVTPVVKIINDNNDLQKPRLTESDVKVVVDCNMNALYFSRHNIPFNAKFYLYHVGIYGFTYDGLVKFVNLPKSVYEESESLEQLRALENNMTIGTFICDSVPISIDTADDLKKANIYYQQILQNSLQNSYLNSYAKS